MNDRSGNIGRPFAVEVRKFVMKTIQGLKFVVVASLVLLASRLNAQDGHIGIRPAPAKKAKALTTQEATEVPEQKKRKKTKEEKRKEKTKDKEKGKASETKGVDQVSSVPDSKHVGGEPDGVVQVANLVYAGTKSSECFADHFLVQAEQESSISTSRRFHAVKLSSDEIYNFPLVIMTGEGAFELPDSERQNLKRFVERGGFLLASAGCSSKEWDKSFRNEMTKIFGEKRLGAIDFEHPVFHTVYDIEDFKAKHGTIQPLEGVQFEGRLGVLYSQDGLNDTAHTTGCCCCGGNEIKNCLEINVNILAYALTHYFALTCWAPVPIWQRR